LGPDIESNALLLHRRNRRSASTTVMPTIAARSSASKRSCNDCQKIFVRLGSYNYKKFVALGANASESMAKSSGIGLPLPFPS
jgi:hypothetical protein